MPTAPPAVPKRATRRRGLGAGTNWRRSTKGSSKAATHGRKASCELCPEGGRRTGGGPPNAVSRFCKSHHGAVEGFGLPIGQQQCRPTARLGLGIFLPDWIGRARLQAELAAHRGTFHLSVMQAIIGGCIPPCQPGMRGVTATQYLERYGGYGRTRIDHLASGNGVEPHAGGELLSSERCSEAPLRMPQADSIGQREHASWTFAILHRRSAVKSVLGQVHCHPGYHQHQASGDHCSKRPVFQGRQRKPAKGRIKEEAEGQGEGKSQENCCGGRGMIADDFRLREEISFNQLLAILPTLGLRSKTRFSSFLARTFRIPRAGSCPPQSFPSLFPSLEFLTNRDAPS